MAGRDFRGEAEQEARQSDAFRQWVSMRVEQIRRHISCGDVLARNGVHLKYGGHKPEQFSCPFHGTDNKPSTRFYPSEGGKPDGLWCFVCQERWDSIALFKKFEQLEGPFTRILTSIERAFGIQTPEMPSEAIQFDTEGPISTEVEQLFDICERRLRNTKPHFTMQGYLVIGSVLDRLRYQVMHGGRTNEQARGLLRQVLTKIGAKERLG